MRTISEVIAQLREDKVLLDTQINNYSWGDKTRCKELFMHLFKRLNPTIERYEYLPEYDEIIDWMTNTHGKGLMLMGDCGRGKSIILTRVIPVLLGMQVKRRIYPVHASEFAWVYEFAKSTIGFQPNDTNLVYLTKAEFPIIDELGVEPMMNDYGEKYEGFNVMLNSAERRLAPVFVSTNLTEQQILDRYGERTIDRLAHLCRTIHFEGDSLRK